MCLRPRKKREEEGDAIKIPPPKRGGGDKEGLKWPYDMPPLLLLLLLPWEYKGRRRKGEGKYRVSESECLFLSLSVLVKAALLSPPLECGRRGFEVGREGGKQGFLCLVEIRRDKRNSWKKKVQRCFPGDRKDRRSVRGRSLWLGYTVIYPASAILCFTWSL